MSLRPDLLAERLAAVRGGAPRLATLSLEETPETTAEAYAVQEATLRRLGARVGGWKVGAGNPQAEPEAAPLLAALIAASPARFPVSGDELRGVEAELAFRFAATPAEPYDEEAMWRAVGSLHVAIELLASRYADRRKMPRLAPLADNLSNGGFCFAPAFTGDWRRLDFLKPEARLLVDGEERARMIGGNPAGHPKRLLAWLAQHCAQRGRPLQSGDIVTTGSHTGLVIAPPGAVVTARFTGLGEAEMTLLPAWNQAPA